MEKTKAQSVWGILRITLGLILLWSFFDKLFGLGFDTVTDKSWLAGNSPTVGFLKFGTDGPLASFYQNIAGNALVDWLFMLGLLLVGMALILGIGMRIAGFSGSLMMLLLWSAVLPKVHNPILDEHIIYILVLLGLTYSDAGRFIGLGNWWQNTQLVKKYPFLK
ncbi:MAG: hypothetical protein WCW66_03855 [Patescibacteria group bacterium]